MKRTMLFAGALALALSLAVGARAEEKTIRGEAQCAKCALKQTKACQTAIKVKEGDKTETYLADNDVAKKFHKNICTKNEQVVATGDVREENGQKYIKLTKIEPAKE